MTELHWLSVKCLQYIQRRGVEE